jgi:hypothetical protein
MSPKDGLCCLLGLLLPASISLWKGDEGGPSTLKVLSSIGLLICIDGDSIVWGGGCCVVVVSGRAHQRNRLVCMSKIGCFMIVVVFRGSTRHSNRRRDLEGLGLELVRNFVFSRNRFHRTHSCLLSNIIYNVFRISFKVRGVDIGATGRRLGSHRPLWLSRLKTRFHA